MIGEEVMMKNDENEKDFTKKLVNYRMIIFGNENIKSQNIYQLNPGEHRFTFRVLKKDKKKIFTHKKINKKIKKKNVVSFKR